MKDALMVCTGYNDPSINILTFCYYFFDTMKVSLTKEKFKNCHQCNNVCFEFKINFIGQKYENRDNKFDI